jgi:hypothetical protein
VHRLYADKLPQIEQAPEHQPSANQQHAGEAHRSRRQFGNWHMDEKSAISDSDRLVALRVNLAVKTVMRLVTPLKAPATSGSEVAGDRYAVPYHLDQISKCADDVKK